MNATTKRPARFITDPAAFRALPPDLRRDTMKRLTWMDRIQSCPYGKGGEVTAKAAKALGTSPASVNRYLFNFRRGGWRGLIDNRHFHEGQGLPEKFQEFVRSMFGQMTRATAIHRVICDRWKEWQNSKDPKWSIPGYDSPPAPTASGFPHGWSADNLNRLRPATQRRRATATVPAVAPRRKKRKRDRRATRHAPEAMDDFLP